MLLTTTAAWQRRHNHGYAWYPWSCRLDLQFFDSVDESFAATYGAGVWTLTIPGTEMPGVFTHCCTDTCVGFLLLLWAADA